MSVGKGSYPGLRHSPHVGEPTPLSLSTAGMYAGELCATIGNYWYKSNWRNIPTSLWRGTE